MATNLIYEDRLDGASNYVQWKVRSVENRKLWRITVTIARSVLLKWGFSVSGRRYRMLWDPGGISKQSSSRGLQELRRRQEWHPMTVRKQEAHLKELSQLVEQQKAVESSSTTEEQGTLVQREQVVEVRVAGSSSTRAGHYGAEGVGHSSTEGASGSNLEGAADSFRAGHLDLDKAGFPDVEGTTTAQDVDHREGSSNGRTSLAKREC
jgi:hypothetical protein